MHDTVDEVGRVAAAEGLDIDWAKGGTVGLARTPVQLDRARDGRRARRAWGFGAADYRLLDADEARERVGATGVLGATYTPHCAAIHPARLVRGLAGPSRPPAVRIHEGTPATAIEPGVVRTPVGDVRAPHVVRATEGYTRDPAGHRRDVAAGLLPDAGHRAAARRRSGTGSAWPARETFTDHRHLIIYGQRTADDRLAFGGRGAPYHFGSRIDPAFDRDAGVSTTGCGRPWPSCSPAVAPFRVTHRWGGPLGISRDWYASVRPRPRDRAGLGRRLRRRRGRHHQPRRAHPGRPDHSAATPSSPRCPGSTTAPGAGSPSRCAGSGSTAG